MAQSGESIRPGLSSSQCVCSGTALPPSNGAGDPGAQGRQYNDGLHACAAAQWARGTESARSALSSVQHCPWSPSFPLQPSPGWWGRQGHSLRERSEEQGSVGATEAEGVAHGSADVDLTRGIWDVIQITLWIRILVVDGGRQHPMV